MSVVVVNDVDVSISAPWHSLYQSLAKMVKSNCNLHLLVLRVAITCTEKHHLVMIGEVAIRDCEPGRSLNYINEAIIASSHGDVINPNILRSEDGNSIPITSSSVSIMVDRVPNQTTTTPLDVMNVNAMDDNILHELNSDPGTISDVDFNTTSIDCFVTIHDKFLVKLNNHASLEYDPQWFLWITA